MSRRSDKNSWNGKETPWGKSEDGEERKWRSRRKREEEEVDDDGGGRIGRTGRQRKRERRRERSKIKKDNWGKRGRRKWRGRSRRERTNQNNLNINNDKMQFFYSLLSLLPGGTRWNRVKPSDLTFQVRLAATNEPPTSNGNREVGSHQSAWHNLQLHTFTSFLRFFPQQTFDASWTRWPGARRRLRSQLGASVGGKRAESSFYRHRNTTFKRNTFTSFFKPLRVRLWPCDVTKGFYALHSCQVLAPPLLTLFFFILFSQMREHSDDKWVFSQEAAQTGIITG